MKNYRQSIKKRVFAGFIFAYLLLLTPHMFTIPRVIHTEAELYRLNFGFPIPFVRHQMGLGETDFSHEARHLPKTYGGFPPEPNHGWLRPLAVRPLLHLWNLVLPLYIMNIAILMLILEWVMYRYGRMKNGEACAQTKPLDD